MLENKLGNSVYNLKIPLALSENEGCKVYPIFKGMTAGLQEISCHVLTLSKGQSLYSPNNHSEEKILLILSGSVNLTHSGGNDSIKKENIVLKEGQFVYYPAHFSYSLKTTSDIPANWLTLKWENNSKNRNPELNFAYFDIEDNKNNSTNNKFFSKTVFESPTLYLKKLHCHTSAFNSGEGVETHRDIYDVVSIILEGEVETLGKKATPYNVIFYATGKPHNIYNVKDNTAREVVFEFHTNKVSLIILINYYFHKLTKLKFWKNKLKKILRF